MAKPISNPPKLDEDKCLARILKFCLFIFDKKSVSHKSLEHSFAEFKEELPRVIRNEEKRDDLTMICKNIS